VRAEHPGRVDSLIFFLDRSLGKHIVADALRQAGAEVELHDNHFPQDARDEEWLGAVGERGWIVLTRDDRIRYRFHERAALLQARVRVFVLVRRSLSGPAMAAAFVNALPAMRRFVARYQAPFIARVTQTGNVSLLLKP
jgi:predicted nuclease of predicted toxin-antitoxin system